MSDLKEPLNIHIGNLKILMNQAGKYGESNVPPYIVNQIQDEVRAVESLCNKPLDMVKPSGTWQRAKALIRLKEIEEGAGRKIDSEPNLDVLKRYLDCLYQAHRYLPVKGFETDLKVPIELDKVYVSLHARISHFDILFSRKEETTLRSPEETAPIEIESALSYCQKKGFDGLIILGDPGSGKTTLLKYLSLCLASEDKKHKSGLEGRKPIFLALRDVRELKGTLSDVAQEYYKSQGLKLPEGFFEKYLVQKNCLILLDGLDEVPTQEERKKVCEWIDQTRVLYYGNPIIVTSRFAGYRGEARLPGNFLELNVQDFTVEDISLFLHQWHLQVEIRLREDNDYWRSEAKKEADALTSRIHKRVELQRLATNPLMLQIIALVNRARGFMPERRVELYEECINVLLERWDRAKGLEVYLTARQARQVLQPLALWLHSVEGRTYAPADEVKKVLKPQIERVCQDGVRAEEHLDRILTSVRDRSGLFVGFDIDRYGFQHLSFQEFLSAEEVRNTSQLDLLIKHFGKSWWKEVTLLAMGLSNPSIFEPFMNKLISTPPFLQNPDFVPACIHDALVKSASPFVTALKNKSLVWQTRYISALALKEIGTKEAIEGLKLGLNDENEKVAEFVRGTLVTLGVIEEEKVLEGLPKLIKNDKDGSEMVLIPAGEFTMGNNEYEREKPEHKVYLHAYYICRYPVTNGQYERFIKETGYRDPNYWRDKRFNHPNQPVVGVSWGDTVVYCEWAGLRLPTEAEWEKASRGTDGRGFPWGNTFAQNKCNTEESGIRATTPVGSYPEGASPYGCQDMAGNVWEWCADWYDEDYYKHTPIKNPKGPIKGIFHKGTSRVVRGGSWDLNQVYARCANRLRNNPVNRYLTVGFRCVRTSCLVADR